MADRELHAEQRAHLARAVHCGVGRREQGRKKAEVISDLVEILYEPARDLVRAQNLALLELLDERLPRTVDCAHAAPDHHEGHREERGQRDQHAAAHRAPSVGETVVFCDATSRFAMAPGA